MYDQRPRWDTWVGKDVKMLIYSFNGDCQQSRSGNTEQVKMADDISNVGGLQEFVDVLATLMMGDWMVVKMMVVVVLVLVVVMAHIANVGAFHQSRHIVVVMVVRNAGVHQNDGVNNEQQVRYSHSNFHGRKNSKFSYLCHP